MSNFVIRAAKPSDAASIVSLLREFATYEKLLDHFTLTEDLVRRDMFGQACHCEMAFHHEEPVGIAAWFWTYRSFRALKGLYVEDLYVRPAYRSQGLGKALLAHLAAKARQAGGFLEWQVLDWNAPSIAFYKSLGARPLENWRGYRLEGESLDRLAS